MIIEKISLTRLVPLLEGPGPGLVDVLVEAALVDVPRFELLCVEVALVDAPRFAFPWVLLLSPFAASLAT